MQQSNTASKAPATYMTQPPSSNTAATGGQISLQPRFFFGLKGDVNNNVFFLNDRKDESKNDRERNDNAVMYPCGHNVIIYCLDDKSQRYIPGIEGSQGITAMAMTENK